MLGLSLALVVSAAATPTNELNITYEKYELPNGLDVILAPDRSTPIVHVNVWYHVGSTDESVGRTGFAHLFEHLMFQGSISQPGEYFDPLIAIGADLNGTTNTDRTNYFETVPSQYLPLALFLESDRMGWLLDVLDQGKLDNQRDVVRNERRQRYETPPYGEARGHLFGALWPEGHPYHYLTIGKHEDLQAANLEDVKAFFKTWYSPDNASLVVTGDFDPQVAHQLIEEYFGSIPKGPPRTRAVVADPTLTESKELRRTEKVPHPRVWIAWQSPALFAPGDAELDLFSSLIAGGPDSKLHKRLVKELRIAQDVTAYQQSSRLASSYIIDATATPGHTTDELVAAIDQVLAEAQSAAPNADELLVAKADYESGFYSRLATIASKGDLLNSYNYSAGDPGYMKQDLQRYLDATPEAVLSAVKATLSKHRVVLHISPEATP